MAKKKSSRRGVAEKKTDRVQLDDDVALVRIFRNGTVAAWDKSRDQVHRFTERRDVEVWPELKRLLTTEAQVLVQKPLDGWVPITDAELDELDQGLSPQRARW